MKTIFTLTLAVVLFTGCGSSTVGNAGGGGEGAVSSSEVQILGLHYEAHVNRLENVFQLDDNSDAFDLLEDSRSLIESQELNSTTLGALTRIYAEACKDVEDSVIPEDMTYADMHFLLTGVTAGQDEAILESDIVGLFAAEDNAEDYIAFAFCLAAATSVDALLLNVLVK